MCLKLESSGGVCTPLYTVECNSGATRCFQPHTFIKANTESQVQDTPGKWADRKCAKKVRKLKCHKRKVKKNCTLSCAGRASR